MTTEPTQAMREIEKAIDAMLASHADMVYSIQKDDDAAYVTAHYQRQTARARLVRLIEEAMK